MKRKTVLLLVLCLAFLSGSVSASNWQYVGEGVNPYGNFYIYIDKDTIYKDGDVITFWEMKRFYKLSNVPFLRADRPLKWMQKYKLLTKSEEYITIENNSYDSNDNRVFHNDYGGNGLKPLSVREVPAFLRSEFDFAIQNAREGTDSTESPDPSYKTGTYSSEP